MSLIREWQQTEVRDFRGAFTDVEPTDVPPNRALVAENVEFFPGQVRLPRFGFATIQSPGDAIASMENWIHSYNNVNYNLLAYLATSGANTGINLLDLATNAVTNLYTPGATAKGACFVPAGSRLYMSTFTNQNWGSATPRVYIKEFAFSSFPNTADPIYPQATGITPTVHQAGVGVNTKGVHNFGFVLLSRSGYTTAPGTTVEFTATTSQEIIVTLTPATVWPNWFAGAAALMTTVDNPSQYYLVPGSTTSFSGLGGTATPVNLILNITDDDLAADGEDATPYFSRYSPTNNPSFMTTYGSRMCYVNATDDEALQSVLYVSEPNDYQNLTADQNTIFLPGQLTMVSCFSLYNTLYILGPHWTYQTADTGDVPITWQQPQLVDGRIGTLSPLGVTVNASQGFAWVADVAGLYIFQGGSYAPKPVSYFNSDVWKRINWNAAYCVKVVDDTQDKRVKVMVPLDDATTPSHIISFDYSQGLSADTVSFSLDSIDDYSLGTMAFVQNHASGRIEAWVAPSDATKTIMRQMDSHDTNPYRDGSVGITATYQTALLPQTSADILHHHGDHMRMEGSGPVSVAVKSLDEGRSVELTQVLVADSPAQLYLRRYHLLSEAASLTFSTSGLDNHAILSMLTHYFSPWLTNR